MCGISGVVDFDRPPGRETVAGMSDAIRHRGPDDDGLEIRGPAALGFRRLSIIDLAGSHQPMSNEDGSLWLVFNGEIYNFKSLRADLVKRGHTLKTSGDGETILHLYEDHGLDFVDHLNGMFAFALWDAARERLVLVRDRLGIKPLYYAAKGRRVAFASETKAILEALGTTPALDLEAIAAYMTYSSIPGWRTCFEGIRKLRAAEMAIFDRNGLKTRQYWDVRFEGRPGKSQRETLDEVDALLDDAVRMQMISDVPLGVFLSGGVDSSLVAAMMAKHSGPRVKAFTIGYGREGAYLNETRYSRLVAEKYGMAYHELILEPDDLLTDIDRVAWHLDEPCGDPAAFLTLALSEFTRRHVTVALSGLGADEIFCGYRRYLGLAWRERYMRLPGLAREGIIRPLVGLLPEGRTSRTGDLFRLARKLVRSVGDDVKTTWARTVSYLPEYDAPIFGGAFRDVRRESYSSEFFEEYWDRTRELADPVDRAMYMDLKMYMVDQLLHQQDKMSMAVSLEARVPYLDHRLVELAATIPVGLKMTRSEPKALLKRLAERYVPRECIYRPKKGFGAPVDAWMRGPLREQVDEALSPARVRARGIFDVGFTEWMKREFFERGRDLSIQMYQVFLLEVWLRLYVDGRRPKAAILRGQAAGTAI
jgi:asparagine synthase (glutamine-hydrolysing)